MERVLGQVPPSRPSCGHLRALDRDAAGSVGQVWEPGVRSAALTTAHSSFHGAQTRLDCEERLHRYNCSIDGPLLMDGVGRILGILVFLYCC